jgi:DNA-binding response OmpR family regulator
MQEKRVLLVEDCDIHQLILKSLLRDYSITILKSQTDGSAAIKSERFDLIVLDVQLEDGDGMLLCKIARLSQTNSNTPILFLTSRSDINDRLTGFGLGADDYVAKPFNHLELKARVEALLRRTSSQDKDSHLKFGPIEVEQSTLTAWINVENNKHPVDLTSSEFKLLVYFLKHPEEIITRDKILESVWNHGSTHVIDRTVDAKVSLLRKKLTPYGNILKSIYGVGYRLSLDGVNLTMKSTNAA